MNDELRNDIQNVSLMITALLEKHRESLGSHATLALIGAKQYLIDATKEQFRGHYKADVKASRRIVSEA